MEHPFVGDELLDLVHGLGAHDALARRHGLPPCLGLGRRGGLHGHGWSVDELGWTRSKIDARGCMRRVLRSRRPERGSVVVRTSRQSRRWPAGAHSVCVWRDDFCRCVDCGSVNQRCHRFFAVTESARGCDGQSAKNHRGASRDRRTGTARPLVASHRDARRSSDRRSRDPLEPRASTSSVRGLGPVGDRDRSSAVLSFRRGVANPRRHGRHRDEGAADGAPHGTPPLGRVPPLTRVHHRWHPRLRVPRRRRRRHDRLVPRPRATRRRRPRNRPRRPPQNATTPPRGEPSARRLRRRARGRARRAPETRRRRPPPRRRPPRRHPDRSPRPSPLPRGPPRGIPRVCASSLRLQVRVRVRPHRRARPSIRERFRVPRRRPPRRRETRRGRTLVPRHSRRHRPKPRVQRVFRPQILLPLPRRRRPLSRARSTRRLDRTPRSNDRHVPRPRAAHRRGFRQRLRGMPRDARRIRRAMRPHGSRLRRGRLRRVAQAQPEQRAALFRVRPRVPDQPSQRNPVRRRGRVRGGEPRADEGGDRGCGGARRRG